jgi:hypothetical protein
MTDVWLESIQCQDHLSLLLKAFLQALLVCQMERNQFFIPREQMCHGSFGNRNSSITKGLVNFRNAPVGSVPQGTNQSNHVQTKLTMW